MLKTAAERGIRPKTEDALDWCRVRGGSDERYPVGLHEGICGEGRSLLQASTKRNKKGSSENSHRSESVRKHYEERRRKGDDGSKRHLRGQRIRVDKYARMHKRQVYDAPPIGGTAEMGERRKRYVLLAQLDGDGGGRSWFWGMNEEPFKSPRGNGNGL